MLADNNNDAPSATVKITEVARFKRFDSTWHQANLHNGRVRTLDDCAIEDDGTNDACDCYWAGKDNENPLADELGETWDVAKQVWTVNSRRWDDTDDHCGQLRFEVPLDRFHSKIKIRYEVMNHNGDPVKCHDGATTADLEPFSGTDAEPAHCVGIIELKWEEMAQAFKEAELSHTGSSRSSRFETSTASSSSSS